MPISRKKSCVRCREAKARCNQAHPLCSRCADRGFRCVYENGVRASPYYPFTPSTPASIYLQQQQQQPNLALPGGDGSEVGFASLMGGMLPDFEDDASVLWPSESIDNTTSLFDFEKGIPLSSSTNFMNTKTSDQIQIQGSYDQQATPASSNSSSDTAATIINNPLQQSTISSPLTDYPSAGPIQHHPRAPLNRRPILKHCTLTNILIGQMTSYPRMLVEGETLPPFVHPPCHYGALEHMAPECGESGRHRCLPEDLSVCAGLVGMFYARTEANARFVWDSIYAEARKLRDAFHGWDKERQLSALQAATIYMLLQADDAETAEKNGAAELLACVTEIAWNMAAAHTWESEIPQRRPDRGPWIHNESLLRITVMLGIIELLMTGLSLPPPRNNPYPPGSHDTQDPCRGFASFHLPCHRDLWQARTTRAWRAAHARHLSSRRTGRVLTVGDLVECDIGGGLGDWRGGGDVVHDVVRWCEGLDALGTLVWMVVPFQKWRRGGGGEGCGGGEGAAQVW